MKDLEIVVLLDDIRSLHNVGSIFRTADAAGVKKIYLGGITPEPIDRLGKLRSDFSKVALGAERTVPWEKVSNLTLLINRLRKDGYKIIGVEQGGGSKSVWETNENGKLALIMGAEVDGVSKKILKKTDSLIEIPMFGSKESLNVAVAFGIVVYSLIKGKK